MEEEEKKKLNQRIWLKIIFAVVVVEILWLLLEKYFNFKF